VSNGRVYPTKKKEKRKKGKKGKKGNFQTILIVVKVYMDKKRKR